MGQVINIDIPQKSGRDGGRERLGDAFLVN